MQLVFLHMTWPKTAARVPPVYGSPAPGASVRYTDRPGPTRRVWLVLVVAERRLVLRAGRERLPTCVHASRVLEDEGILLLPGEGLV